MDLMEDLLDHLVKVCLEDLQVTQVDHQELIPELLHRGLIGVDHQV